MLLGILLCSKLPNNQLKTLLSCRSHSSSEVKRSGLFELSAGSQRDPPGPSLSPPSGQSPWAGLTARISVTELMGK